MGGKLSRATKISSSDSDTDLFDQNLTSVNTPQTTSNDNPSNSGSVSVNLPRTTAVPALRFSGNTGTGASTATGLNANFNGQILFPETNENNVDTDQLIRQHSTGKMMYAKNSEYGQSTEDTSTSDDLINQNSYMEISGTSSDESNDQNSEHELIFQSLESSGQNFDCELMEQSSITLVPQNSLIEQSTDEVIDSSSENFIDPENANQTSQIFTPAYTTAEILDNANISIMNISPVPDLTSISADTNDALHGPYESGSTVDQTLQNVTSDTGVELLHCGESESFQDGVSPSSSSNDLSSEQLIQDIEDYNNQLQGSSTDLADESDEDFEESSETSIENEMPNSNMEEQTESQEDLEFASSLKQVMDNAIAPGAGAVVSSDTQCCHLTSGEQTITDNTIAAEPIPRNCISAGEICDHTTTVSTRSNNKRKSDGDAQEESQSKRLAVGMEVAAENDIQMLVD